MYRVALLVAVSLELLQNNYWWILLMLLFKLCTQTTNIFKQSGIFSNAYETKLSVMYRHINKKLIAQFIICNVSLILEFRQVTCRIRELSDDVIKQRKLS
jgi:hypothetical protein